MNEKYISEEEISENDKKELALFEEESEKAIGYTINVLRRPEVDKIVKQAPPKFFVKHHPFGKYDYIPIAIIEPMAQMLDPETRTEILREGQVVNAFYCVIRLQFNGRIYEGIGAAEFQTAKGAAPTDFTKLNTGAIQMAVPKARSEAVKNAFAQVGDLFGRSLRREHSISMGSLEDSEMAKELDKRSNERLAKLKENQS